MDDPIAASPSGAQAELPAGGRWVYGAAQASAVSRAGMCALGELGVIAVTGDDAVRFLHGQLTNDVEHLGTDRVELAGYCTPKGRLLATMRIWRDERAVYLLLPREVLPGLLRRLSMFVLRAKAKLTDESDAWRAWAVFGASSLAPLRAPATGLPESPGALIRSGRVGVARLAGSPQVPERFLLLAPAADAADLAARLADLPAVDSGVFWWSEICAGMPTVFSATQEKFVPQMINFEVVGGVSFSKGCYPGQEVVARSQFRGRLKRRMQLAHCAEPAAAGADVFEAGNAEPVGTVVMSASAPGGGCDLLVECPLDRVEETLHLARPDGPVLELRALPYELVDVTA